MANHARLVNRARRKPSALNSALCGRSWVSALDLAIFRPSASVYEAVNTIAKEAMLHVRVNGSSGVMHGIPPGMEQCVQDFPRERRLKGARMRICLPACSPAARQALTCEDRST